ncbi:MAG: hypothetical protein ACRDP1_13570 [Nocardioidaceae bacterium]
MRFRSAGWTGLALVGVATTALSLGAGVGVDAHDATSQGRQVESTVAGLVASPRHDHAFATAVGSVPGRSTDDPEPAMCRPGDYTCGTYSIHRTRRLTVHSSPFCRRAHHKAHTRRCRVDLVVRIKPRRHVAARDLTPQQGRLLSTDGTTTLEQAVDHGRPIFYEDWHQTITSIVPAAWGERQSGRIFLDGAHVWSTSRFRGYRGSHHCSEGYGHGYDITVQECSVERRVLATGHPVLTHWDRFKVSAFVHGFPVWATYQIHANAYPDGTIWLYYPR